MRLLDLFFGTLYWRCNVTSSWRLAYRWARNRDEGELIERVYRVVIQ